MQQECRCSKGMHRNKENSSPFLIDFWNLIIRFFKTKEILWSISWTYSTGVIQRLADANKCCNALVLSIKRWRFIPFMVARWSMLFCNTENTGLVKRIGVFFFIETLWSYRRYCCRVLNVFFLFIKCMDSRYIFSYIFHFNSFDTSFILYWLVF